MDYNPYVAIIYLGAGIFLSLPCPRRGCLLALLCTSFSDAGRSQGHCPALSAGKCLPCSQDCELLSSSPVGRLLALCVGLSFLELILSEPPSPLLCCTVSTSVSTLPSSSHLRLAAVGGSPVVVLLEFDVCFSNYRLFEVYSLFYFFLVS